MVEGFCPALPPSLPPVTCACTTTYRILPLPFRINSMIMIKLFYVSTGSYFTLCWNFYSLNSCQKFRTPCSSSGALLLKVTFNNQLRDDYHFYRFSGCLLRLSSYESGLLTLLTNILVWTLYEA